MPAEIEETPEQASERRAQAFAGLREISEQLAPFYEEQMRQRGEAAARLESRFADRNLRFTLPFGGDYPVQAFGHLDDMRFYFRYRWGWATLKVGPYDRDIEERHALRSFESRQEHLAKDRARFQAGEIDEQSLRFSEIMAEKPNPIPQEDAPDFYPHLTAAYAELEDPALEGMKGDLRADEAEAFFAQLVEKLQAVPPEQQLSEYDRILYYEGWEAARAWYDSRK